MFNGAYSVYCQYMWVFVRVLFLRCDYKKAVADCFASPKSERVGKVTFGIVEDVNLSSPFLIFPASRGKFTGPEATFAPNIAAHFSPSSETHAITGDPRCTAIGEAQLCRFFSGEEARQCAAHRATSANLGWPAPALSEIYAEILTAFSR